MPKIFELAKELNLGALDLVESLKKVGLSVRNHMSEISPEDWERVRPQLFPEKKEEKKVVKKKVVKKATSSATTEADSGSEEKVSKEEKVKDSDKKEKRAKSEDAVVAVEAKSSVKKRSVVVRKKTDEEVAGPAAEFSEELDEDRQHEEYESSAEAEEHDHVTASDDSLDEVETGSTEEVKRGLKVVYDPSKDKALLAAKEKARLEAASREAAAEPKADKKEYFKEKMHSFTPVFIPEKKAVKPETKEPKKDLYLENKNVFRKQELKVDDVAFVDKDALEDDGKKRLGGLAAMVAKPKVPTKARDINLMRSEEELKSYSLGALGKAIYKTVGKKKVWSGLSQKTLVTEVKESKRVIHVHNGSWADEFAAKLNIKFETLVNRALEINLLLKPKDYLGFKLASKIANLFNYRVEDKAFNEESIITKTNVKENVDSSWPHRNPIVTIMGHVDHGKTSLLDYIRRAKVAQGEAGGITQHIGAYSVEVNGKYITFLDTPGHAAFANMRSRGAKVTDITVLVVAADDGVMPQTKESIRFCQAANVPIIVAVNKIDKEGVNPDKIKNELMEFGLTPEEWGGETLYVPVSALKGTNIDKLLETISLQAEMMDLRADPKADVQGVVIESFVEVGRGPLATVIVQAGTLEKGDYIVAGECMGRARSLMDYKGEQLKSAPPSTPVQILGFDNPPSPGDIFNVVKNEREAKKLVENRILTRKQMESAPEKKKVSLEDFFANKNETDGKKLLKIVLRTDVQGSYEAIKNAIEALGNSEVGVQVIGGGVGAITDNDVVLASTVDSILIGFNMRPVTSARRMAEDRGIQVKTYSIIYELIDDIKSALEGLLAPIVEEKYIGRAEVRNIFNIPKYGVIAGSAVVDGKLNRGCKIRLLRDGKIMHDGKLNTLKRFKDEVKEVGLGYECGVALENFNDIKVGDIFEAYLIEEKKRTLDASPTL
ncbi:MAG: translation initiation factor IF-2 [Bacteriovoracaceae bacterium]